MPGTSAMWAPRPAYLASLLLFLGLAAGCRSTPEPREERKEKAADPTGWYEDRFVFVGTEPDQGFLVELLRVVHDDEVVRRYRIVRVDRDGTAIRFDRQLHGGGDPAGVPPHEGLVHERKDDSVTVRWQSESRRVELVARENGWDLDLAKGAGPTRHRATSRVLAARGSEDWTASEGRVLWSRWHAPDGDRPSAATEIFLLDDAGDAWLVRAGLVERANGASGHASGGEAEVFHLRRPEPAEPPRDEPADPAAPRRVDDARAIAGAPARLIRSGREWVVEVEGGARLEVVVTAADDATPWLWVEGKVRVDAEEVRSVRGVLERRVPDVLPPSPGPRDRAGGLIRSREGPAPGTG